MAVKEIHAKGLLHRYNSTHPESRVQVQDVFVSANGVLGDWDRMLAEFSKETVSVVVERPSEGVVKAGTQWDVAVEKEEGENIGVNLFSSRECRGLAALCVSAVNPGPLAAFNVLHQGTAVQVLSEGLLLK